MKIFKTKHEITHLTNKEAMKYKKELDMYYVYLKSHCKDFIRIHNFIKLDLKDRLEDLSYELLKLDIDKQTATTDQEFVLLDLQ
jgi:hypothetical protein